MADNNSCLDLTVRRFVYSSLVGVGAGLLFFRSPAKRWASFAFGAGIGIGSAYTECNTKFSGFSAKSPPTVVFSPPTVVVSPPTVVVSPVSQVNDQE